MGGISFLVKVVSSNRIKNILFFFSPMDFGTRSVPSYTVVFDLKFPRS